MNWAPRSLPRRTATSLGLMVLTILLLPMAADGDDRDLLRFKTAKPYLFLLLDTSSSMNLRFGPHAVADGHGDDPSSRLYGAKEALFTVFENVEDVNFGFAAMNQDGLRVHDTHWLYYLDAVPPNWPFQGSAKLVWPIPDPDGLTTDLITEDTDNDKIPDSGDGIPDGDTEGDVLVFGPKFIDVSGNPVPGGTCQEPIAIDEDDGRAKVNAFARLGSLGDEETVTWFRYGKGGNRKVYRVAFDRPELIPDTALPNNSIGADNLYVTWKLSGPVSNCSSVPAPTQFDFLMRQDPNLNRFVMVDRGVPAVGGNNPTEDTAALWPWEDATIDNDCSSSHPFSGKGWEGNYDADVAQLISEGLQAPAPPNVLESADVYCLDQNNPATCVALKPMVGTTLSPLGRPLDYGDMIPFNWQDGGANRDLMLQRLAPNWPLESLPNFGVTYHLSTALNMSAEVLEPRLPGREPILAQGNTALAKAMNDFRCWYMGGKGRHADSKCGDSAYFESDGWSALACGRDPDYGCRRPYLIVISDGNDVCKGEDATADVSDMKSFSGISTWALNLGDPQGCQSGGGLHSIVQSSGGTCINVADKDELKQTLEEVLGQIRETARAFATAAVPTVQTTSDQAIYVSSFTPLNEKSVWDGHMNAFLKPLPLTDQGTPNTAESCNTSLQSGCHLWDAGEALKTQYNAAAPLGNSIGQRRINYPLFQSGGAVPRQMRPFEMIDCSDPDPDDDCVDLLFGLNIPFDEIDPVDMANAEMRANAVISTTLSPRTHTLTNLDGSDGDTIEYLLGDVFHSNPLVVGSPPNVSYWVQDLQGDGTDCTDDETGNPGYRCFFQRHRFRRKVLLAGGDDGMLHAFDSGRFHQNGTDPGTGRALEDEFDNGTGHELFAVIPRKILPTIKKLAEGNEHHFAADGTPRVADVFIDPAHNGSPVVTERRWRTVAIAGLREGGAGYYAVDITQPDKIGTASDGETLIPDDGGPANWVPTCISSYSAAECGPSPYAAALWEILDTTDDSIPGGIMPPSPMPMDEDMNLLSDLGDTWSTPNIGRIQVCRIGGTNCTPNPVVAGDDADVVVRDVAIFGGGMDPDAADKSAVGQGDWLYMVDIETGKIMYKRQLCSPYVIDECVSAGAATAETAAVDTNQDGLLDRIYLGTTAGFVFRVDLTPDSLGRLPSPIGQPATALDPELLGGGGGISPLVGITVKRIPRFDASGEEIWQPRAIFDSSWDSDGMGGLVASTAPRQIYHPPSVFFVANVGLFGLAFGTGNREDLWAVTEQQERFYVFVDDSDELLPTVLPLNEGDFQRIEIADGNIPIDLLTTRSSGERGWFLTLEEDERVITDAFALSGVTIFSSFVPETALSDDDCDPLLDPGCTAVETLTCGDKKFESDTDNLCSRAGSSKNFVVGTANGNGFLRTEGGETLRYKAVSTFVTNPFTEPGQNKNADPSDGSTPTSDSLTDLEIDTMDSLKTLFPDACRFANYRVDIKTVVADTRVERIAPIPVCIVEKNWKEY